ncbi:MAG: monovalent cation/H(+) antiporter subunit G [Clostridia bacterium]|nr:monovalent cation/H(+) antiporter subunit G [Clostridia bacterium]
MEWIRFYLTAALVLAGLVFCCIGVYGVFKFKYAVNRMHAAAIVDTLGISLCMLGFAVSAPDLFSGLKIVLVIVFWWLSSPVASHLLCRLEITTDEQRSEYMRVHDHTLAKEREMAEAAVYAAAGIDPEEIQNEEKGEQA